MLLATRHKIALARMVYDCLKMTRSAFGLSDRVRTKRKGILWDLDLSEGIDFSVYLLGSFEPSTIRAYGRLIKPGHTVLDIGANVGAHTLHFAKLIGSSGKVIAFEPTDYAFGKLRNNAHLNPALEPRIISLQTMLLASESVGVVPEVCSSWPLKPKPGEKVNEHHQGRAMSTQGARAATLDTLVKELGLTKVDFIKLDVDGFEWEVLQGARQTLSKFKPMVLMEFAPHIAESKQTFVSMLMLFKNLGYKFIEIKSNQEWQADPKVFYDRIPQGASRNFLLSPTTQ
jgi:FkbM family methyltransferase